MLMSAFFNIISFSQRQISFLGNLEWTNIFGQRSLGAKHGGPHIAVATVSGAKYMPKVV